MTTPRDEADPLLPDAAIAPALGVRRPRLLVVDDQPENLITLHQLFGADHQLFMAFDGAKAVALCQEVDPDLVLLDIVMPGMDGYEVCRQLQADPKTRNVPVIFVTAHADAASEARGLSLGAVDFISKPINPVLVRARVKTHLTLKHQSDLLRNLAFVDGLTSVANRRAFDDRLQSESRRAQREGGGLSVALIDVDHFKSFNDTYGHLSGDDCLRRVAIAMRQGLRRPGDFLARYGGEEFGLILPGTGLAGARTVCEELFNEVQALGIAHRDKPGMPPVLSLSAGIGSAGGGERFQATELLALADFKLYAAKAAGRARIHGAELT